MDNDDLLLPLIVEMVSDIQAFLTAKVKLLTNIRALKARDGKYCTATIETEMIAILELVRDIGFTRESPEIQFLAIAQLFHEFANEIPEERWKQALAHYGVLDEEIEVDQSGKNTPAPPSSVSASGLASIVPVALSPPLSHPNPMPCPIPIHNPNSRKMSTATLSNFANFAETTPVEKTADGCQGSSTPFPTSAQTTRPSGQGDERSRTSGKSTPLPRSLGPPKRVILRVKKGRDNEGMDIDTDRVFNQNDSNRMHRSVKGTSRKGMVSVPIINISDSERQNVKKMGSRPRTKLPIAPASRRCDRCDTFDEDCWIYLKAARGRPRRSCVRCNLLRKACSFNLNVKIRMSSPTRSRPRSVSMVGVDDAQPRSNRKGREQREQVHGIEEQMFTQKIKLDREQAQKRSKKGKQKRLSGEADDDSDVLVTEKRSKNLQGMVHARRSVYVEVPSLAAVWKVKQEEAEWQAIGRNEAGPSSNRIRCPVETRHDLSEIYARLTAVEANCLSFDEVTTVQVQESQQDVDRLDSNAKTVKKHFEQKVSTVEQQSELAIDRSAGVQEQIGSIRQEPCAVESTISAMQSHSEELTEALATMMQKFVNIRFDLPNLLDYWVNMRHETLSGTIAAGVQLRQGTWEPSQLPSTPSFPEPHLIPPAPLPMPDPETEAPNPPSETPPPLPLEPAPSQSIEASPALQRILSFSAGGPKHFR